MRHTILNAVFLLSCLLISPAAGHDCWGGHHCGNGGYCGRYDSRGAQQGDTVSVTGFEVSGMEGDLVVTTEIRKGDQRVVLRDPRGQPVW